MDFEFSEEQTAIRELAREILAAEATPERARAAEATPDRFDRDLWAKLAEANLLGIAIPEAYGGMGYGFAELCVLLEEIGRHAAPVPAFETLVLGALPITAFGTDAQRAAWLSGVAAGYSILAASPTGLDARPSPQGVRARREGDQLVLDGAASNVACASLADAVLVAATTDAEPGVFLVDPKAAGVELHTQQTSTAQPISGITLTDVHTGEDVRLGGSTADGGAILAFLEERALVGISALQIGVSERALELTTAYAGERVQFKRPIGSFQAVQHRCADAFIDLQALRWTVWRAAWRISQSFPALREARVAKFWAADAGSRIVNAAIHLHGGIGADLEYPIHRYFLWSKALELDFGSAGPQLARLGRDMAETGPQEQA